MDLKDHIASIPDFPKPGINFYDISPLLSHADAWSVAMSRMAKVVGRQSPDILAGIESRGFILGAPLAYALGKGFVPIRKKGKLPAETIGHDAHNIPEDCELVIHSAIIKPTNSEVVEAKRQIGRASCRERV